MLVVTLLVGMLPGLLLTEQSVEDLCVKCHRSTLLIDDHVRSLRNESWRQRASAAQWLGTVRWQCHPEVVAALIASLQSDDQPRVRVRAAEALEAMTPNLPNSHLALLGAARSDPAATVRKHARAALAAKGLRCMTDCPICGPLPTGAAIIGPQPLWPEWRSTPDFGLAIPFLNLPPALADPPPRE